MFGTHHMERTRRFRKSCKPLIFSQPRNDTNTTHRICRGASEWVSMSNVVWFALWRHSAKVPSCSHMWYLWFMQIHPRILHSEHFPSHLRNSNPIPQSNMVITWKACRLDWNCVRQKERHRHSHRHQNSQTHTHTEPFESVIISARVNRRIIFFVCLWSDETGMYELF